MANNWIKRKSHYRRLGSGKSVYVNPCWVYQKISEDNPKTKKGKKPRYNTCPECGAKIISRRMPNGGMVHSEAVPGLTRIKHPCLYRGDGLSKQRDKLTLELFDMDTKAS